MMDTRKSSNSRRHQLLSKDAWIALISVVVGGAITFLSSYGFDLIKENAQRIDLANVLYLEVRNNLFNAYVYLDQSKTRGEFLDQKVYEANDFDFRILNAYIHDIHLLSHDESVSIFAFYGDLGKADEAKKMLMNGSKANPRVWLGYIYDNLAYSIKFGKFIMSDFEKKYKIKRDDEIAEALRRFESTLIERDPDLFKRVPIFSLMKA